jgi:hypothetical protein
MAGNQLLFGMFGIGKDTERTELSHKATVKAPLEGISNQRNGRLVECARFMQKSVHAKCMAEKLRATNAMDEEVHNHEQKGKGVVESPGRNETGMIRESQGQASKSFKRQQIISGKSRFITSDPSFTGFPFLHPRVDLQILHVAIHEFASDKRNVDKKQHDMLVRALQCVPPTKNKICKLFLIQQQPDVVTWTPLECTSSGVIKCILMTAEVDLQTGHHTPFTISCLYQREVF